MSTHTKRCRTIFLPSVLEETEATSLYSALKEGIEWEDGVKTRIGGFTRKAKAVSLDSPVMELLIPYILPCIEKIAAARLEKKVKNEELALMTKCEVARKLQSYFKYVVLGVYLNNYEDGDMYTPAHSHPGQHQLVISLGATRTLNVGSKSYEMNNGSAIFFGSATHGVPREPAIKEGRISIAVFMSPIHDTVNERPKNSDGEFEEEEPSTEYADEELEITIGDGGEPQIEDGDDTPSNIEEKNGDVEEAFSFLEDTDRDEELVASSSSSLLVEDGVAPSKIHRVDTSHLPHTQRIRNFVRMFGDLQDRQSIINEINEYLKAAESDPEEQEDFLQQLEERDDQARYDYLNEWRSDDIDEQLFGSSKESPEMWADRLYAMYTINGLTRGERQKPPSRKWAARKVKQYSTKPYELLRAAERRHSLPLLGIKWEDQLIRREKYGYEGPYLIDDEGYVIIDEE